MKASIKNKLIYTCVSNEVLTKHQPKLERTMDEFFSQGPLQGVIQSSLISWEVASVKVYYSSSKSISFSEKIFVNIHLRMQRHSFQSRSMTKKAKSKSTINLMVRKEKSKINKTTNQSYHNVHKQHDSLKCLILSWALPSWSNSQNRLWIWKCQQQGHMPYKAGLHMCKRISKCVENTAISVASPNGGFSITLLD